MTKEQERAEIAFKALSDLDNVFALANDSFKARIDAMRILRKAKSAIEETFR